MKVDILEPLPLNEDGSPINPLRHDLVSMGTHLGTNVMALHDNFDTQQAKWLIIVDQLTGQRIKITFPETFEYMC